MSRQPSRTPGVTEGREGRRYTRQDDMDSDEEEEEEEVGSQQMREQLVFDRNSGKLVVKEQPPRPQRPMAPKVVLTGMASSGFF